MSIVKDIIALKDAIVAGDYKTAWQLEIKLQQTAFDLVYGLQGTADTIDKAELQQACTDLVAACNQMQAGADAIGDGKILAFLVKILPLIIALL